MAEKSERPTDKKLEDARKKGQVPMSRDLARLAMVVALGELAFMTESLWRGAVQSLMELAIMRVGKPFLASMPEMITSAGIVLLAVFATLFLVCIVVATVSHWGQFGVLITTEPIQPNIDKLNPVNGFKNLFSIKKILELLITLLKGSVIGLVMYLVIHSELPDIVNLSAGTPADIYAGFMSILKTTFHIIIVVCLVLAVLDFAMQKYQHTKSLMMDMEEIKREYKESEGDPMVKGQRKQLAREWANSGPVAKTQDANAVVVNPTHFAVAMRYDQNDTPIPVVLAKGKDDVAQAMIRRARECGIPVIRHVWLARTLYATAQEDSVIPKSSYEAVAHVYAVVQELYATDKTGMHVELENYGEPPESMR